MKTEVDITTGLPQDQLTPDTIQLLKKEGCPVTTATEVKQHIAQNPEGSLAAMIQNAITRLVFVLSLQYRDLCIQGLYDITLIW